MITFKDHDWKHDYGDRCRRCALSRKADVRYAHARLKAIRDGKFYVVQS